MEEELLNSGTEAEVADKRNELYEKYYRELIGDHEFVKFIEVMRRDLHLTFRVSRMDKQSCTQMSKWIEKFSILFFDRLFRLPWYPDGCGWQVNLSRRELKNRSSFPNEFFEFLQKATDLGYIWRQEAVSMIPCLFLSVKSDDNILDMCAAPGSKTAQLVELLHISCPEDQLVQGLVLANDKDSKRCNTLITQTKKLNSLSLVVSNNDAKIFPKIFKNCQDQLLFDSIICDVPCSGDGTLRKNPDLWRKWSPKTAFSLHKNQVSILSRAISLAASGAKIVYSTCSLNPIENEAVVFSVLQKFSQSIVLVDCANCIPHLKFRPGLSTWRVMDSEGNWISNSDKTCDNMSSDLQEFLPPDPSIASQYNLNFCMRFYPHDQDTGGFFVAVFKVLNSLPLKFTKKANISTFAAPVDDSTCSSILTKFYEIHKKFPTEQLFCNNRSSIHLVSKTLSLLLKYNPGLSIRNYGVIVFKKFVQDSQCIFRPVQSSLHVILPFMGSSRIVLLHYAEQVTFLFEKNFDINEFSISEKHHTNPAHMKLKDMSPGPLIFKIELQNCDKSNSNGNMSISIVGNKFLKGSSITLFVKSNEIRWRTKLAQNN